jgi:hypothetical protein
MKSKLILAIAATLAAYCLPASAATYGAEYCQKDACGNGTINNTKPDAEGFASMMSFFGHTRRFLWANGDFWPNDNVDNSVSGGLDAYYGDNANITFFSTHGGSNAARFVMTTGKYKVIDGLNTCGSYTSNPNTGTQWWKLGNGSNRIVNLSTCHGLELTDLAHWDAVVNGAHMICAFDGNESDSPSVGSSYAFFGNLGFSVKQAWFTARPGGNKAVVMAYGTSASNAVSRRDGESFFSSMAAAPPHSWRAWAWIQ